MLYLIIGIACNILLLLILRSFHKFNVSAFPSIIVNYFVAGSFSLLFTTPKTIYFEANHLWLPALFLGSLFVSIFYLISQTTVKLGVSVASVANKMSVIIPVILAFIIYKDSPDLFKILGIIIALLSVFLVSASHKKEETGSDKKNFMLPLAVFLGSGIIDALVNYAQKVLVHSEAETACFSGLSFYSAGLIGVIAFTLFYKEKSTIDIKKTIIAGIILGTPNFFSIYFIMKAIDANFMQSSVLYPILNVSVVLGSTLCAYLFFAEKLSVKNMIGIGLSVLAIAFIALS
ncbi:MAG: EamA family transporter [Bacteroidia bacterium]